ncbi:MAG: hypothetical protein P0S95_08080 [Rhabdochlamydiaceae bacterium]|nr:hypothetical protein [Candidatus Amphrikana amoebophyrae]
MKYKLASILIMGSISAHAFDGLSAAETSKFENKMSSAVVQKKSGASDIMIINPDNRAKDFKAAFDILQQEVQGSKIIFTLTDKSTISGIMEIQVLPGGTMLSFMLNTTKGIKYKIVPIEQIKSIMK